MSANPDADFVFRLTAVAVVMAIPPGIALWMAVRVFRTRTASWKDWTGGAIALLTFGMLWVPVDGAVRRARQAANLALAGVPAPEFRAADLDGNEHRLSEHRGSVVLVNIWATWCPPCRAEMPLLDELARKRADQGFAVFGISTEDEATQQSFRETVLSVDYPLLLPGASDGPMPDIYVETARWPATFLIDREGLLHPAPSTEQPFSALEAAVDRMLASPAPVSP